MEFKPGVYTVMPTFFKESEVDIDQLINAIKIQIASGIKNIVLLGTTSETPTLTNEEQEKIVQTVWENFNGQVNIIVGIGGNNTKTTLENAFKFRSLCDAFMVTVPYYNKPSQEGIYQHFATIAQLLEDKSIILYNIPSRCGVSMEPEIIANLYNSFDNIKAIKEATGSLSQAQDIRSLCDIMILSGDDSLTLPLMSIGGSGVVSVASNLIPKLMLKLVELYLNNDLNLATNLNQKLYPVFKSLFLDTNPVPLKYLINKVGLAEDPSVRLPLVGIQSKVICEKLDSIIDFINTSEKQMTV
jgi:4-hydroxy-tetrahydrodipicolinate synthase